jgi:hypothetical protein
VTPVDPGGDFDVAARVTFIDCAAMTLVRAALLTRS